jgi:antitoxin YefM
LTAPLILCTGFLHIKFHRKNPRAIQTNYTDARTRFAGLCDGATINKEIIIIQRCSAEDVALIAADELAGLQETAHHLRSPKNVRRLLVVLERALQRSEKPEPLKSLQNEMGTCVKKSAPTTGKISRDDVFHPEFRDNLHAKGKVGTLPIFPLTPPIPTRWEIQL